MLINHSLPFINIVYKMGVAHNIVLVLLIGISSTETLNLTPYPTVTVELNQTVLFNCSAPDNSYGIQWYLNDDLVQNDNETPIINSSSSSQLSIVVKSKFNATVITCVATGTPPIANRSSTLFIRKALTDTDKCFLSSSDIEHVCFTCIFSDDAVSKGVRYRLKVNGTNITIHEDNALGAIGQSEIKRCIAIDMDGIYEIEFYAINSHGMVSSTVFDVISGIEHTGGTTQSTGGSVATTESGDESDNIVLFKRYETYILIIGGVLLGLFLLISISLTVCVLVCTWRIGKHLKENQDDLSRLDPFGEQPIQNSAQRPQGNGQRTSMQMHSVTSSTKVLSSAERKMLVSHTGAVSSFQTSTITQDGTNTGNPSEVHKAVVYANLPDSTLHTYETIPLEYDTHSQASSTFDHLEEEDFKAHVEC